MSMPGEPADLTAEPTTPAPTPAPAPSTVLGRDPGFTAPVPEPEKPEPKPEPAGPAPEVLEAAKNWEFITKDPELYSTLQDVLRKRQAKPETTRRQGGESDIEQLRQEVANLRAENSTLAFAYQNPDVKEYAEQVMDLTAKGVPLKDAYDIAKRLAQANAQPAAQSPRQISGRSEGRSTNVGDASNPQALSMLRKKFDATKGATSVEVAFQLAKAMQEQGDV